MAIHFGFQWNAPLPLLASYLRQRLFHEHAEEDGVAQLAKALEDIGPQIRVLNEVVQDMMIITYKLSMTGNTQKAGRKINISENKGARENIRRIIK